MVCPEDQILAESWVSVGRVKGAQGLRGELFISLFSKTSDWIEALKSFRLVWSEIRPSGESCEKFQEFLVISKRAHKMGLVVGLMGIADRTFAEHYRGAVAQIPSHLMVSKIGERIFLREILGFGVVDVLMGELGRVASFSSNFAQDLLVIEGSMGIDQQVLEIPFVPDFLVDINWAERIITMRLPEGLVTETARGPEDDPGSVLANSGSHGEKKN